MVINAHLPVGAASLGPNGVTGSFYLEDPDTILDAYTSLKVYSGTSEAGSFTNLVDTITLVAGQTQYSFTHSAGLVSTLYRASYYTATGPVESSLGPIFRPSQFTLARLRYEAARLTRHAAKGTCSSAGTAASLIDSALIDSGVDTFFHGSDWVYRPNAVLAADRVRRLKEEPFTIATGALAINSSHGWTNYPENGEAYEIYQLFSPIPAPSESTSWDDIIRSTLRRLWVRDQVNLGPGVAATGQRVYSLTAVLPYFNRYRVTDIWFRTFDANNEPTDMKFGKQGSWWHVVDNADDGVTIHLSDAPTSNEYVIADVSRTYPVLYLDTDIVSASEGAFDYAVAAVARQALISSGQAGNATYMDVDAQFRELRASFGARTGGVLQ